MLKLLFELDEYVSSFSDALSPDEFFELFNDQFFNRKIARSLLQIAHCRFDGVFQQIVISKFIVKDQVE